MPLNKSSVQQLAVANHATKITWWCQDELITRYKPSFFKTLFSSSEPTLIPQGGGVCYALVGQWYQLRQIGINLLEKLHPEKIDNTDTAIIRNIGFAHQWHTQLNAGVPYHKQGLDRGNRNKLFGITAVHRDGQENWIENRVNNSLFYTVKPTQPEIQEKNKDNFFGHNITDFEKVIKVGNEDYPGALREILIGTQYSKAHYIGYMTELNEECQKQYIVFDPAFGEFCFNTLQDCQNFLIGLIKLGLMNFGYGNKDDRYARVDVTTFTDSCKCWPKNSACHIKNNLLKGTNLGAAYEALTTTEQIVSILAMAKSDEEASRMRAVLCLNARLANLLSGTAANSSEMLTQAKITEFKNY